MKTLLIALIALIVSICVPCTVFTAEPAAKEQAKRISEFKDAVVMISRTFKPEEIINPKFTGNRATAWFYSTRSHLITIEHVVHEPELPTDKWTEVWISQQNPDDEEDVRAEKCDVRLFQIIPASKGEGLAILELRQAFRWGKILQPETEELQEGEEVFSLGYPNGHLMYVSGFFHGLGKPGVVKESREGMPLYELTNNTDRLSFNAGASGSPILNKKGNVIGVISVLFTEPFNVLGEKFETGTAWGQPTHMATSTKHVLSFKFPN